MKTKRLVALMCVLAIIASLFAGCTGASPSPSASSTPTPEATSTPEATPTPTVKPTATPTVKPTATPAPTPTPDGGASYIKGYLYTVTSEEDKTAKLTGFKLEGFPQIASKDVREAITELVIPSEVDGYTITELSWDVMGQSKYGGSISFCGEDGVPDCYVKKVTIPATIEHIEYGAFSMCGGIEEVIFEGEPDEITFDDNVFGGTCPYVQNALIDNLGFFIVGTELQSAKDYGDVVIPDGVTKINTRIWEYQKYNGDDVRADILSITVPDTVVKIQGRGFVDSAMTNIEWVYIPRSVKEITGDLFNDGRTDVVFKCEVGSYAASYAIKKGYTIEYVDLPEDKKSIGWEYEVISEEDKTAKLTGIILPGWPDNTTSEYRQSFEGTTLYLPTKVNGYKITRLSWDVMGQSRWGGTVSFCGDDGMPDTWFDKIYVPKTVEYIEYSAFAYAQSLKSIIFEDASKLTYLEENILGSRDAAYELLSDGLGYLVIGHFLQNITDYGDLVIPEGVEVICDKVWKFTEGEPADATSVTIPEGVVSIGKEFATEMVNLEWISLPESLTAISGNLLPNGSTATVKVKEGSWAHEYATEKGYTVELVTE